eukprot:TRINITY_DN15082_c0_g2_i2.p1 TRINITY_DN15082_c0_g2~~TRINITY_DN15082_c0_g2_i2.p1  ORF type:complete len:931 (+),score=181.71 TRINITY_DN15082_c0_g2_i2:33-2795(+)
MKLGSSDQIDIQEVLNAKFQKALRSQLYALETKLILEHERAVADLKTEIEDLQQELDASRENEAEEPQTRRPQLRSQQTAPVLLGNSSNVGAGEVALTLSLPVPNMKSLIRPHESGIEFRRSSSRSSNSSSRDARSSSRRGSRTTSPAPSPRPRPSIMKGSKNSSAARTCGSARAEARIEQARSDEDKEKDTVRFQVDERKQGDEQELQEAKSGEANVKDFNDSGSEQSGSEADNAEDDEASGSGSLTSDSGDDAFDLAEVWETVERQHRAGHRLSTSTARLSFQRNSVIGEDGPLHFLDRGYSALSAMSSNQLEDVMEDPNPELKARLSLWTEENMMLQPYGRKHLAWEIIGSVLLCYDIFMVPFSVAFEPPTTVWTATMLWIIRIFWTMDLFICFFTGYIDEQGVTVLNMYKVARRYASSQFPLDLLIVVFDWLDVIIGVRATGILKSWRLVRVMRLVRLRKATRILDQISEYMDEERVVVVIRTCKNLLALMILLHFFACLWWFIGELDTDSWNVELRELDLLDKYMRAFHLSLAQFFGEHIILPYNLLERAFTIFVLYSSFIWQIWLVSSITTAMTHLEIIQSKKSSMFSALERFMTMHSISRDLRLKVQRNAHYAVKAAEQKTHESSIELLSLISEPLMIRLHYEMFTPIFSKCHFLRCFMLLNDAAMRKICHVAVSIEHISKDDVIFAEMEKPLEPKVLFNMGGKLQYLQMTGEKRIIAPHKHWLSEMTLWTDDWLHKGTARAETDCRILSLDVNKFRATVGNTTDGIELKNWARFVLSHVNQEDQSTVNDVGEFKEHWRPFLKLAFQVVWDLVDEEFVDTSGLDDDDDTGRKRSWGLKRSTTKAFTQKDLRNIQEKRRLSKEVKELMDVKPPAADGRASPPSGAAPLASVQSPPQETLTLGRRGRLSLVVPAP